MTSTPAETASEPVIALEMMDYDVAVLTTEHRPNSTPSPSSSSQVAISESPASELAVKHEDDDLDLRSFANLHIAIDKTPTDNIFFFKRMTDAGPRFDALMEVGRGELLPGSEYNIENGMWEVHDGLYVLRKTGPSFKVLQSIGKAQYEAGRSWHKAKHIFSLKTCAFLANRDASGSLHVLCLCISGDRFKLVDPNNADVLHNPRWTRRVKEIAKLLDLKMGSPYDSHGKKATAQDVGDWAAGHTEKKLSAFLVYALLQAYGCRTHRKVTIHDLRSLRKTLRAKGIAPRFEIHLTRAPCGTPKKPGKCVAFVQRLSHLTGVEVTINYWEQNVILDGTVPPRTKKKASDFQGNGNEHGGGDDDHASDSEEEDLQTHLAEKYPDDWGLIVRDGFDEVNEDDASSRHSSPFPQQIISPEAVQNFRKKISEKFKRARDDITKPYPPTPVWEDITQSNNFHPKQASTSFYFNDDTPSEGDTPTLADLKLRKNRAAKAEAKEARKQKKREAREKAAAAAAVAASANNNAANVNAAANSSSPGAPGASVIAGRLGALAHSSQRIG
ncbi:hypothetical protein CkaCkLH20_04469 [Colletotrichum karsti]|uniref:Uncharacterized protein n=1 Tax=Colletotrichum karsti TaxID=1095194 RepID=A0A9P6I7P4_9PEZI|nr:uncharacterized protein CkaCkLH20_04469 [Colletotrichum karsti]KAF9877893.1 hypothetical protein CkaCkLH20_04469 [Colletotrichum karsti]